jgi:2,3-diaminopropionate biosynthesis protein SbnB
MIYISDKEIRQSSLDWENSIDVIESSVKCLAEETFSQPVKPYLRYRNLKNRIIAMPAFVGGEINMSGIKWIASFPDNVDNGIPRAHCVLVLNNADTGEPVAVLNSGTISAIRTASVSGFVLRNYLKKKNLGRLTVAIVGFGPIGQHHLRMCASLLDEKCAKVILYDLKGVDLAFVPQSIRDRVVVADNWQEGYDEADIFITCTVSADRYIDRQPKPGSLHLNVSLRDYKTSVFPWFKDAMVVDDWEEICRENTDVERFHLEMGIGREQAGTIMDLLDPDWIQHYDEDQAVLFNPMGMAIFDIAIGKYYVQKMKNESKGCILD